MKTVPITDTVTIFNGDCRDVMATFEPESVDAVVSDPPYGLGFMGKGWDHGVPGVEFWEHAFRVLKPGGYLLAFGGSRTFHRLAVAIEDAGFEIRDTLSWMYGSGFPKSHNVSKAIDKLAGAEREVGPVDPARAGRLVNQGGEYTTESGWSAGNRSVTIDPPATDEAAQWDGWGTALKPAWEPIIMARKPLSVDGKKTTVAKNVLAHGTGAINIDASRISTADKLGGGTYSGGTMTPMPGETRTTAAAGMYGEGGNSLSSDDFVQPEGRFPANVLLTHHDECRRLGTRTVKSGTAVKRNLPDQGADQQINLKARTQRKDDETYAGSDGMEDVEAWNCQPDCPIRILDEQSGSAGASAPASGPTKTGQFKSGSMAGEFKGTDVPAPFHADKGGASRFFYNSKTSKKERNAGLPEGKVNDHPTVKPVAVMAWLVEMVTPPGGTVLDPFMGSGTTGVAAVQKGFGFLGIDDEAPSCNIAWHRIKNAAS